MVDKNIKFISIFIDNQIFISRSYNQKLENEFMKESQTAFQQIQRLDLQKSERQRLNSHKGTWNCVKDSQINIHYLVLTQNVYPEKHSYALLIEVQQLVQDNLDLINQDYQQSKSQISDHIKSLFTKYNDINQLDKIQSVQFTLKSTETIMENNLNRMLQNQDIERLEKRASKLKEEADQFNLNSYQLQNMIYKRNLKLKILIGLIGIALFTYVFILPFTN